MQRPQAFKYALMPTGEQQRDMRRFAGACRFVFNKGLALQKERYERGEKKLGYAGLCKELTEWRNSKKTPWLADGPVHTQQQTLKDLERAYANFFQKRAAFPRFKRKGLGDSFRYPDPKQIKIDPINGRIFLPKLGWLRYRNSRDVLGELRNATVSQIAGKWFVSIQTERTIEHPVHPASSIVGIDLGIAQFATLSDGTVLTSADSSRRCKERLAFLQRRMSKKRKFSRNWVKAKAKVQQLHHKIACIRRDHLHQATSVISKSHAIVVIEDLKVRNMSASVAGTNESPGQNARAKAGLNRSILDQGWFEFRRQLQYKQDWAGGWVIVVPPQNTSRMCSCCGHIAAENRVSQSRFECVACGHRENADANASKNILAAGHAVLASGEWVQSGPSMKQEPTEATAQFSA
ncbi:putative insertion element transposase InsQ (plasmid) [Pararobbsia alpina]|uniref:RNA-guided endonuclease InsQ/TnpB family protein n=1 Tax=Pararobbsia alpina TaxID=621374 RepID=UPI0039A6DB57